MIKTVTPARAAEILREHGMRTKAETIRCGIEQGKFPFGDLRRCPPGDDCTEYKPKTSGRRFGRNYKI